MAEIVDLALRVVIDSFEIYTINYMIKEKFETNFIMFKTLFKGSTTKTKKYYYYYWRKFRVT